MRRAIEPVFDIEAETRVRVPEQIYNITLGFSGTTSRFSYSLNSDPPLPQVDILSVLLGQPTNLTNAELRALRPGATQQSEEVLLRQAFSRMLTSPISAPVSRILGETFGIETCISPTFGTETRSADAVRAADPRSADLQPRVPHVRARAGGRAARADHHPRIRSE